MLSQRMVGSSCWGWGGVELTPGLQGLSPGPLPHTAPVPWPSLCFEGSRIWGAAQLNLEA